MRAPLLRASAAAALLALALLPAPTQADGGGGGGEPPGGWPETCTPSPHAPRAPFPLRAFQVAEGILLHWDDEVNALLGVPVDAYLVYRALDGQPQGEPYAILQGVNDRYIDTAGSTAYTYWVRAANCAGPGASSNSASASVFYATCVDWDLDSSQLPPLNTLWLNSGCLTGETCFTVITLVPPDVREWCS